MSSLIDQINDPANVELLKHVTGLRFTDVPEEYANVEDADAWDVYVEWRGGNKWSVKRGPYVYSAELKRSAEPQPSSRTDGWLKIFRHDLADAIEIAQKVARTMTVNGMSAEKFAEWCKENHGDLRK